MEGRTGTDVIRCQTPLARQDVIVVIGLTFREVVSDTELRLSPCAPPL
jgi:hypothetical protein